MEEFSYYGITPEEAVIRGMKIVKYLEVEAPDLCRFATEIPRDLEDKIERFDVIWSLPILEKYVARRRIDEFIAFREILQNALDIEHEMYGYDNIQVRVEVDDLGTHVIDRGKGITWRAFLIGGSEKPEWMRGHFGEGLDLATLMFGVKGHPVFFFTKNIVFKTVYYPKTDTFFIVFGRSKMYVNGTHVLIYKWKLPKDIFRRVYWKNNPELEVIGKVMINNMPNMVFRDKGKKTKLYVRDIYVNESDNIAYRPFYFSYNLWWVELDPNRTNVASSSELSRQMKQVLVKIPNALVRFIEDNLEMKEYGGVPYYTLKKALDYYEGTLHYRRIDDERTRERLSQILRSRGISAYSDLTDLDAVSIVGHEGGTVLLVPSGMKELFSGIIPNAHDFVIESVKKTIGKAKVISENMMRLLSLQKFAKFRLLARYISKQELLKTKIEVVPIVGRSHTVDNIAYVDVNEPPSWFIHEIAHALGHLIYGDAPDVSENLERCLEKVGAYAMEMAMEDNYRRALKRIENGCVYAKPRGVFKEMGYKSIALYKFDFERLEENPCIVIAGMESPEREYHLVPLYPKMSQLIWRFYEELEREPYLPFYERISEEIVNIAEKSLRILLLEKEPSWDEYIRACNEIARMYSGAYEEIVRVVWGELWDYRVVFYDYRKKGYTPVLLKYDLKQDAYKVVRRFRI